MWAIGEYSETFEHSYVYVIVVTGKVIAEMGLIMMMFQVPRDLPVAVQQRPPPGDRGDRGGGGAGPDLHLGHPDLDSSRLTPDSPRQGPEPRHLPG